MTAPDSAMKLFLKHTPDALEHLFDKCISVSTFCESEQVQGKNSLFKKTVVVSI